MLFFFVRRDVGRIDARHFEFVAEKKFGKAEEEAVFWGVTPGENDLHRGDERFVFLPIFVVDHLVLAVVAGFRAEKHVEGKHEALFGHRADEPIVHAAEKGVKLLK